MKQLDKVADWPPFAVDGMAWWAGWLLAEMSTHDDRETRDALSWSWDPARPIAGQGPGGVDLGPAIDQLLEEGEAARRDAKERQAALDAARDRPIGAADVFDDEAFDVSDVLPDSEQR